MSSPSNAAAHWIFISVLFLFQTLDVRAQLDGVDAVCACPQTMELTTELTLHGDVEVDGKIIGGTSTLVPAGTAFTFDTVFFHDNNRFFSANCLYQGLVKFAELLTIGEQEYTEGNATVVGLGYAYAPVELAEIICSFASKDLPVGVTTYGGSQIGVGDSIWIIQYRYTPETENAFGREQISEKGNEIIERLHDAAYLRTCKEAPPQFTINSIGDEGLSMDEFDEHHICTTGDSVLVDGIKVPECTLRAAIEYVNALKRDQPTTFGVKIQGAKVILPDIPFDIVQYPLHLNGANHFNSDDKIIIDGSVANDASGLKILASNCFLRNLEIRNFLRFGIEVGPKEKVTIDNCQLSNNKAGIVINNNADSTIITNNIISRCENGIVSQFSKHTLISGNYIGTNNNGDKFPSDFGISGTLRESIIENNVIGHCGLALSISGEDLKISSNNIGTDHSNKLDIANTNGIRIGEGGFSKNIHLIGNYIQNNDGNGIEINSCVSCSVTENIVLNQKGSGIEIKSCITCSVTENIVLNQKGSGISITADNVFIEKNTISGNSASGLLIRSDNNVIQYNTIGLDVNGQEPIPNLEDGIRLSPQSSRSVTGNLIVSNLISANKGFGINDLATQGLLTIIDNNIGSDRFFTDPDNFGNNLGGIHLLEHQVGPVALLSNRLFRNGLGILVEHSKADIIIASNSILHNDIGIHLRNSQPLIISNRIKANGKSAIIGSEMDKELLKAVNNEFFQNGGNTGIHLDEGVIAIRGNQFIGDASDAIFLGSNSTATIHRNNFINNKGLAINNQNTSISVPAADNWFGDASGPSGIGAGSGDAVSTDVDFQNWLVSPVGLVAATVGDTIYVPAGDTVNIPVYGQNWITREDQLNFSPAEEQNWMVFNPDQLTFLSIQDSLALKFPIQFIVPATPLDPENEVLVQVRSLSSLERDTVKFLLIAQARQLTNLLLSPADTTLEPGDSVQFIYSSLDQFGAFFNVIPIWEAEGGTIDSNGLFIAGDIGGTFSVTLSAKSISVQVEVVIDAGQSTVIATIGSSKLIELYPNPFSHEITIKFGDPIIDKSEIRLYDIFGNLVYSEKQLDLFPGQENTWKIKGLNALSLPSGAYVCQLMVDGNRIIHKLIKL